jgi:hypothetical protein
VADLLRAEGFDCHRRGKDQRAREESGELRTDLATGPALGRIVGRDAGDSAAIPGSFHASAFFRSDGFPHPGQPP